MNEENVMVSLPEDEDDFDVALREAVRQGRVLRTKDDKGRDVYTAVKAN